jgi:hypothetical protein
MRRKLFAAVPIAAASVMTGLLLSPGVASAAPPTKAQLQNWTINPEGSFTATGPTLCASGNWSVATGTLIMTCSNGTDSITFGGFSNAPHGKMDAIFSITSGTGAFAGATGQLTNTRDSGTTGFFSGSIS